MKTPVILLLLAACTGPTEAPPPAPVEPEPVAAPEPPPEPEPEGITVPDSPEERAAELVRLEAAIRDDATSADILESVGHLHQRIYRAISTDPDAVSAVREHIPESLHPVFDLNVQGTRRSAHTVTRRRSDLPPWNIVQPPPAEELMGLYRGAAEEFSVPWEVLAGIHLVETRMGRIRGTSHAGAQGPMQFMPATWEAYGEGDVTDYRDAIRGAAHYLSEMGASRDLDKAIWHYNHSDDYIAAVRSFADVMGQDPKAYRGYWGWQVYYQTTHGDIWLDSSYSATERTSVAEYCATVSHCPPSATAP